MTEMTAIISALAVLAGAGITIALLRDHPGKAACHLYTGSLSDCADLAAGLTERAEHAFSHEGHIIRLSESQLLGLNSPMSYECIYERPKCRAYFYHPATDSVYELCWNPAVDIRCLPDDRFEIRAGECPGSNSKYSWSIWTPISQDFGAYTAALDALFKNLGVKGIQKLKEIVPTPSATVASAA